MPNKLSHQAIDSVIGRNIAALRKPGVLTVRPGFKMTGGWITDKPAIVATVNKKLDGLRAADMLPAEIEDVPVDVREATGRQRLRAADPRTFALAVAHGHAEFQEPEWKLERSMPTGKRLSAMPLIAHASLTGIAKKPKLPYTAPANMPLAPVTRPMTIIAHASPDDGFPVLKDFLTATKTGLSVGMYDFTSADILAAVKSVISPGRARFKMVLDHPPRNQSANQTDDQTVADLRTADPNAKINWALTRNDPVATQWVFPTAYHIKVAVRDSSAFWLSSGNFNVSNQPNFQSRSAGHGKLSTSDRDWHVVVMDPQLAKLYEAYLGHDFSVAQAGQGPGNAALHRQIRSALKAETSERSKSSLSRQGSAAENKYVHGKRRVFTDIDVTIQPLLTPDPGQHSTLYVDSVLALIKSATRSIYMQTQYIHPSDKPVDKGFMLLVGAMSDAVNRGLDVRIITSQYESTGQWLEKLKPFGLDRVLRIQNRVHNKGIVVDSKVAMVSSQNWSGDGTLRNRDAGLIITNADIAEYFEAVFMEDWTTRAHEKLVDASHSKSPKKPPVKKKTARAKGAR